MITGFIDSLQVEELRQNLIGKFCKNACGGCGAIIDKGVFLDCVCVKEFSYRVKMLGANIPKKHWDFTFRNLLKNFTTENDIMLKLIKKYCENIDNAVEEGVGLFIQGTSGLAKSALGCYVLKEALKKDVECYFIRMSHLTKLLMESISDPVKKSQVNYIRRKVKLLLIDEIEKDYKVDDMSRFSSVQVNEFFGDIYDQHKALIVTSNITKAKLKEVHASNVVDRMEELIDVVLLGSSFRGQSEALEKLLGGNV
jgi:DNA replication protein DnaC